MSVLSILRLLCTSAYSAHIRRMRLKRDNRDIFLIFFTLAFGFRPMWVCAFFWIDKKKKHYVHVSDCLLEGKFFSICFCVFCFCFFFFQRTVIERSAADIWLQRCIQVHDGHVYLKHTKKK